MQQIKEQTKPCADANQKILKQLWQEAKQNIQKKEEEKRKQEIIQQKVRFAYD